MLGDWKKKSKTSYFKTSKKNKIIFYYFIVTRLFQILYSDFKVKIMKMIRPATSALVD